MDTVSLIDGSETIDDLIRMNKQFRDVTWVQEVYYKADVNGRTRLYNDLIAWYVMDVALAKRSADLAISTAANTYNKHLGINRKRFYKEASSVPLIFTKYASIFLYFGFVLSFLLAVALFILTLKIPK